MENLLEIMNRNFLYLIPCIIVAIVLAKQKYCWLIYWLGVVLQFKPTLEDYMFLSRAGYGYAMAGHIGTFVIIAVIGAVILRMRRKKLLFQDISASVEDKPHWVCICGMKNLETVKTCQKCGVTKQFAESQKK